MDKRAFGLISSLCVTLLSACSSPDIRSTSTLPSSNFVKSRWAAGVVRGNFTEYALPAGANPVSFTKGPYSTLWFDQNDGNYGTGYDVYAFAESSGKVQTYSQPSPWSALTNPVATNGVMYFLALDINGPGQNPEYLADATSSGSIVIGAQIGSDEQFGTLVLGPDGNLWFPDCLEACTAYPTGNYVRSVTPAGASGVTVQLPSYNANELTPGPLGYVYVTASYTPGLPPPPPPHPNSAVFVLSMSGKIVHKFFLPRDSNPSGIATGSDHNLWIAEPGINKIARMTPSGAIAQFNVPTRNAGTAWITPGADGALWFTETNAGKIGRLTTSGAFRQFTIPTASSSPGMIQYCYPGCGPHYGVWFTETSANQIAKFDSPI